VDPPASARVPDHHVHTQWSWDAPRGSMDFSCRRAVQLGLPSIAFTEHADWVRGPGHVLEPAGYLASIERCRSKYRSLRILSGIELGEPHRHPVQARELIDTGAFDRLVGSVHCVDWRGSLVDASTPGFLAAGDAAAIFRAYLAETLTMIETGRGYEVLAHLDYPKRYWPHAELPYREKDYEEEFRAVLRAAARRGLALEVNTTRGHVLCPGETVLGWWRQEGGGAVAFGSDAHSPDVIAEGFGQAAALVEAAGFRPQGDPSAFWRR
jgi:histidinol-phosphatase (PHP family)